MNHSLFSNFHQGVILLIVTYMSHKVPSPDVWLHLALFPWTKILPPLTLSSKSFSSYCLFSPVSAQADISVWTSLPSKLRLNKEAKKKKNQHFVPSVTLLKIGRSGEFVGWNYSVDQVNPFLLHTCTHTSTIYIPSHWSNQHRLPLFCVEEATV